MTSPVTCKFCLEAIAAVERGEQWFVGNRAKPAMGHQMIFTRTGRIAACLSPSRESA